VPRRLSRFARHDRSHLKCQEPWYLNAADLVCASNRVDLKYVALVAVRL